MAGRKKADDAAETDVQLEGAGYDPETGEPAEELDETIPGGAYLVDGVLKNAEGQPIDKKGKVKE